MTHKVSISRRWTDPIPIGRDGKALNKRLWPQRRRHVWIVRWFAPAPGGKIRRCQRTFKTRTEAEAFQAERQDEFNKSPQSRQVAAKCTLGVFVDEFLDRRMGHKWRRLHDRTLANYRVALSGLSEFLGRDRALATITRSDCLAYVATLHMRREQALQQVEPTGAALSLATINKTKGFIRAAFNIAVAQLGHVRESPWQGIGSDPVPETPIRYVTAEEFVAILNAVHDLEQSVWWRALLTTLYTVGLRYSEAIHLTIGDLDFERDTIQVAVKPESRATIAWSPKTYQTRTIPAPAMTMTLLAQLLEKAPEGHAYVFLTAERLAAIKGLKAAGEWHGLRSVVNNVVRSFRHTVVRAAGCVPSLLDGDNKASVSMHDLRRTCITNWSRSVNMQTVMRMAGHSRIETTMRYYAATTEDQLDLVRQTSTASLAQTDAKLTQNTLPDPCCSLGRVGNSRSD